MEPNNRFPVEVTVSRVQTPGPLTVKRPSSNHRTSEDSYLPEEVSRHYRDENTGESTFLRALTELLPDVGNRTGEGRVIEEERND